jgi:thiol:disulfide interchange protein
MVMGLWELLGFAALGGLILNILPCVLPVIPIKILSFLKQSDNNPLSYLRLTLLYCSGLVISFAVLGGICAIALATGSYLGFGFQMYSPLFNGLMAALMAFLGLKLMGVTFWKNRPIWHKIIGFFGDWGESLKRKSPEIGAISQGCLTTLLGSACTGPFLGAAMGASALMGPTATFLAFLAAGVGMALPYALLGLAPGLHKYVPKSGKWITYVERICGILMIITACWFGWLAF